MEYDERAEEQKKNNKNIIKLCTPALRVDAW